MGQYTDKRKTRGTLKRRRRAGWPDGIPGTAAEKLAPDVKTVMSIVLTPSTAVMPAKFLKLLILRFPCGMRGAVDLKFRQGKRYILVFLPIFFCRRRILGA